MKVSTLRPGLLVCLSTNIGGNVSYTKRDIEADHKTASGERRAIWETERTIAEPAEHEEAVKVRGKVRSLITAVCSPSAFGLLCPDDKADKLSAAISEARQLANDFNARASVTAIGVHVLCGRIAQEDVAAVRAINGEVRDLLTAMETGIKRLDVDAIRKAADKAKALGDMLSDEANERVKKAIEVARAAAKNIVRTGEAAAKEVTEATLRILNRSRTAFLDFETEAAEVAAPVATTGRVLDFEPLVEVDSYATPPARKLDFDELTEATVIGIPDPDDANTMMNVEV